jgi:hypothetical protein
MSQEVHQGYDKRSCEKGCPKIAIMVLRRLKANIALFVHHPIGLRESNLVCRRCGFILYPWFWGRAHLLAAQAG